MERWSYKVVTLKPSFFGGAPKDLQDTLNAMGAQGWELVNTVQNRLQMLILFFKRPA